MLPRAPVGSRGFERCPERPVRHDKRLFKRHPGTIHLYPGRTTHHRPGRWKYYQFFSGNLRASGAGHGPGKRTQQPGDRAAAAISAEFVGGTKRDHPQRRTSGQIRGAGQEPMQAIRQSYLQVLSRFPSEEELAVIRDYLQSGQAHRRKSGRRRDWALLNSKIFVPALVPVPVERYI